LHSERYFDPAKSKIPNKSRNTAFHASSTGLPDGAENELAQIRNITGSSRITRFERPAQWYAEVQNPLGALKVNELKPSLNRLRLFQFAMIAAIPMFGWVAEMARHPGNNSRTLWHWVVAFVALYIAFAGSRFRRRMLARAATSLAQDASDPRALKQWEGAHIVPMAFAENIALWGLLVRVLLGGTFWEASLFYSVSLILLLYWTPRLPTATSVG
jgi:F0F1-type ATP synthase membrane subunit c/vacuolar-type H+-ATPase subunit K